MGSWADWLSGLSGWKPPSYDDVTGTGAFGGNWTGASSAYGANLMGQYGSSLAPQARDYMRNRLSGFGNIALLENLLQGNTKASEGNIGGLMQNYLQGSGSSGLGATNYRSLAQSALDKLAQMRQGTGTDLEGYGFYSSGEATKQLLSALMGIVGHQADPYTAYLKQRMSDAYAAYMSDASNSGNPGDWISYVLGNVGTGLNYGGNFQNVNTPIKTGSSGYGANVPQSQPGYYR